MSIKKDPSSAELTARAARLFSRRLMLKSSLYGAALAASPAIVHDAFSSSGTLSLLNWDDELPDPVIPDFEKATGIKVKTTPFSQNE